MALGPRLDLAGSLADLALERAAVNLLVKTFDESKHRRGEKGTHQGGKFVSSQSQQSASAARALHAAAGQAPGGQAGPGQAQRIAALRARLAVLDKRIEQVNAQLRKLSPATSPASQAQKRSQAAKKAAQTRKGKGTKKGQAKSPAPAPTPQTPAARKAAALARQLARLQATRRTVQVELVRALAQSQLRKAAPTVRHYEWRHGWIKDPHTRVVGGTPSPVQTLKALRSGAVKDTQQAHTVNAKYTAQRRALHAQVLAKLFAGKTPVSNPQAIFTAGGGASGKSRLIENGHIDVPGLKPGPAKLDKRMESSNTINANPDTIKAMLPEYQLATKLGDPRAAAFTHEESSHIANLARTRALKQGYNVLVDGVGDSEQWKFARKIQEAKIAGHTVSVHYATVPLRTAIARDRKRFKDTGRLVGPETLRTQHASVTQRFARDVRKINGITVRAYDTKGPPQLFYVQLPDGKQRILDSKRYREFLLKGKVRSAR